MSRKLTPLLLVTMVTLLSLAPLSLATTPPSKFGVLPGTRKYAQNIVSENPEKPTTRSTSTIEHVPWVTQSEMAPVGLGVHLGVFDLEFVGWLTTNVVNAILHPFAKFDTPIATAAIILRFLVKTALPFLDRTGIRRELREALKLVYKHPDSVFSLARIQASFATSRPTDCSTQLIITEEYKRKLLAESKRYFTFSKEAYEIPPSGDKSFVNTAAEVLGISPDQILFVSPNGAAGHDSDSYHFVAVDNHTNSVVLTLRGTHSVPDFIVDATAFTGT